MGNKKQVAIHEAGHACMTILTEIPWTHAEIKCVGDENYKGSSWAGAHDLEARKVREYLIKDFSVLFAGFLSEEIHLGKEIDFKNAPGSAEDFFKAQMMGFVLMGEKYYLNPFAGMMMQFTKYFLRKNWLTCVVPIANKLMEKNRVACDEMMPEIKIDDLLKPTEAEIGDLVKSVPWITTSR